MEKKTLSIKTSDAVTLVAVLEQISKDEKITDMQTNMAIGMNLIELRPYQEAHMSSLKALVDKYVKKDNVGKAMMISMGRSVDYDFETKENRESFISEQKKILDTPVSVSLYLIKMSVLEKDAKTLSGAMLAELNTIIDHDSGLLKPA